MEAFSIARLETEMGWFRLSGSWDPLHQQVQLNELAWRQHAAWQDVSHWLTEQAHEKNVAVIHAAALVHLNAQKHAE